MAGLRLRSFVAGRCRSRRAARAGMFALAGAMVAAVAALVPSAGPAAGQATLPGVSTSGPTSNGPTATAPAASTPAATTPAATAPAAPSPFGPPATLPGFAFAGESFDAGGYRLVTYRSVDPLPPVRVLAVNSAATNPAERVVPLRDRAAFPAGPYGVVAELDPPLRDNAAVAFALDGRVRAVESRRPLSLAGDDGVNIAPLSPADLTPGEHVLTVTPYRNTADAKAGTNPLPGTTVTFTVAPAEVRVGRDQPTLPPLEPGRTYALERGGRWRVASLRVPTGATLTAFGDPALDRPRLVSAGGPAVLLWNASNVTLRQLALEGDLASPALRVGGGGGIAVEGCEITLGSNGVSVEPVPGGSATGGPRVVGVRFVGCDVHDNYTLGPTHAQGLYAAGVDGLVLEGNVFDANGWDAATGRGRTMFNHDVYVHATCGPVRAAGNVFARPGSHGMQARSGGVVAGNLFLDCPIGLSFGHLNGDGPPCRGGVSGEVSGNAFVGGADIGTEKRGIPLEVGNVLRATVDRNLIAHFPRKSGYAAVNLAACRPGPGRDWDRDCVGIVDLTLSNNRVWDWGGIPIGLTYGATMGDNPGNRWVRTFRSTNNRFDSATPTPDLRRVLGDPVARARAGTPVAEMLRECFAQVR
ncbi:MAG TPA: right-handed parallel beta-helix repeat-containing protein [Humisphaera sp.]